MRRPDRHNEIEINLLQSGRLTYLLGGRKAAIPPDRLAVFWAAIPHQIVDASSTGIYYVVTIPLTWFLQCKLPEHVVRPLLQGEVLLDRRADANDLHRFKLWLDDLRVDPRNRERPVFLEIEARLWRLSLTADAGKPPAHASTQSPMGLPDDHVGKVERMAAFIAMHSAEPLAVADISDRVGLHPSHAMTVFKRTFGMTLMQYLTEHRISNAKRLLVTTDDKILSVALASGFGSISRFNASFRESCGCSPRDFRRQYRL